MEQKHTPGPKRKIDPIDDTKLLLDRIISWEKDLSEYPSLESILREQFVIYKRKAKDGKYEIEQALEKVAELTKENERLKDLMGVEHCPSLADCCRESTELDRLREEKKELVEALRELYKQQPTMLTLIPDAALDFLDLPKKATLLKVESLLSKFEVPNQSKT